MNKIKCVGFHGFQQIVYGLLLFVTNLLAQASLFGQQSELLESGTIYFVLLDESNSMNAVPTNPTTISWLPKIEELKRQMSTFITSLPTGTDARFYSFAETLKRGPAIAIKTDADREQLKRFVLGLNAQGMQTRLWQSLHEVLQEAAEQLDKHPNLRVRVLAYTDGDDNASPATTNLSALLEKYGKLLKHANVQLTYITIGFELQAEQRQELTDRGVQVRAALTPDDVIPLQASFQLVPSQVIVGERVTVLDDSIGFVKDRRVDWGDGSPPSDARSPIHVYTKVGEYEIRLFVTSATGKESTTTRKLRVIPPPAPKAVFIAPPRVAWKERVTLVDRSTGDITARQWFVDDKEVSADNDFTWTFTEPGLHRVRLVVRGPGGEGAAESKIEVQPPPAPVAQIAGLQLIDQDDTLSLFDRSTGLIDRAAWYLDGAFVAESRDFRQKFPTAGEYLIVLKVAGPGGRSQAEHRVQVRGPDRPKADFTIPNSVPFSHPLPLVDRSQGLIDERTWSIDGTVISDDRVTVYQTNSPGKHDITLSIVGPGGRDEQTRTITVEPIPQPVASFVIGTSRPLLDETANLTDTSLGEIETATWFLPDHNEPIVVDYRLGGARSLSYTFTKLGTQTVKLRVTGPGGESELVQTFAVATNCVAPQPIIETEVVKVERDYRVIRFKNRSTGTILETTFNFGDGSPPVKRTGMEDELHEYKPGTYQATIQVRGCREYAPIVVDIPILVPKPWPAWFRHLFWIIPGSLATVTGGIAGGLSWRKRLQDQRLSRLTGALNFKRQDSPLASFQSVPLDAQSNSQRLALDDPWELVIKAVFNPTTHSLDHTVELLAAGELKVGPVALPANELTSVGPYELKLVQVF